jgi:hypothetical protein
MASVSATGLVVYVSMTKVPVMRRMSRNIIIAAKSMPSLYTFIFQNEKTRVSPLVQKMFITAVKAIINKMGFKLLSIVTRLIFDKTIIPTERSATTPNDRKLSAQKTIAI